MNGKKNNLQFISVPFKAESGTGVTEYNGIAKFSPAGIVFEFDSVLFGLIGGEVKEVRVALDEILDIKFRKGIYKIFAQIQLRLKNFTKLAELPNYSGKVKLKIKREDYELARKAVEQTLQHLSGNDSPVLPPGDDSNKELPPAQISVSELFETEKLETKDLRETNNLDKNKKLK
jgi:hypothetical protein